MREGFGTLSDGQESSVFVLKNSGGMEIRVSDYGASLINVFVPDKDGQKTDVVLGYDDACGYEKGDKFFGATVGRCANRIGGACFKLNGKIYELEKNDHENNLHSGTDFYNKRIWQVKEENDASVTFALHSPDMDQGFPGAVDIEVTYTLTEDNAVKIQYHAVPTADTVLNMTNHSYFNMDGEGSGTVLEQEAWINADAYTRADAFSIPTGEITPVEGTPMDFREGKTLGKEIDSDYEAIEYGGGYDHNWVLNGTGLRKVAELLSRRSGIKMEVLTDLPGMQVYTANFLTDDSGKHGKSYGKRSAVCFETQYFPDAVNKENFEGPVVRAGETYETETIYRFSVLP